VDPDDMISWENLGWVMPDIAQMAAWLDEFLEVPEQYEQIQANLERYTND